VNSFTLIVDKYKKPYRLGRAFCFCKALLVIVDKLAYTYFYPLINVRDIKKHMLQNSLFNQADK